MIVELPKKIFSIVLYQPEIPANTGNIIRLAACLNVELHLVHPLGFNFSDRHVKRAGLDYHDLTEIIHYDNIDSFWEKNLGRRILGLSTKASISLWDFEFHRDDMFIFGPETKGLPNEVLIKTHDNIKIPMNCATRSLNLSNAAAVIGYEAMRQILCQK